MSVSRLWLALVLALFCLPLFVGLGRGDVLDDEAIYSFAVDRMLETGDWLEPKSIPNEDWAFVEKPPLKFWIVALPMQLGLLPHDQFGLRFWDALFGATAFGYVFLIGSRLLNPIAGVVAVLMLFVHGPLLFYHGLRSNNMEAALFLCYCGGTYHFMRWAGPGRPSQAGTQAPGGSPWHAVAVGLYFVLGFMTKFVAALFLPAVLFLASIAAPAWRRRLIASWKTWLGVACLATALILPWFVWAYLEYGAFLWEMMLGAHVVTRFTSYLDPAHVQPWYFYFSQIRFELAASGTLLFGAAGVIVLLVQTIYRRWPEGMLVLLWLAVPLAAISVGTSKLYHYMYPFLPPVALAGGYLVALALAVLPGPVVRRLRSQSLGLPASFEALRTRPVVRGVLLTVAAASIAVAFISLLFGPIRFDMPGIGPVRSSGVFRPILIAIVFGTLGGAIRRVTHAVIVVLVVSLLPLPAYRRALVRLNEGPTRLRDARDCLLAVQQQLGGPGLHVDAPPPAISHPLYYYLRQV
ncbi:MAG: ArnT family glycosyltransferase, partial [Vicinamibacterales bacterium]